MANFPLLPADRYIADLLGLSEEQYRYYMAEVRRRAAAGPQPAYTNEINITTLVVGLLINAGLTIVSLLLAPKPRQSQAPQLRTNQAQGQTIVDNRRYTPRQGFDSLQDIATLGTPIPLVYAKRELIGSEYYGGVRVNVPLIWSNIISLDKAQVLRAMFLIGEGDDGFLIDPNNTAIGNNTLGSYLLGNANTARFSVYFRPNGGRIASTNLVAGTSNDAGALSPENVFGVLNPAGAVASDFCQAQKPNTQTQFGVYSLIGNGLGYRLNPSLRPGVTANLTVDPATGGGKKGGSGDAKARVVCDQDFVALAQRNKFSAKFSGRSCLYDTTGTEWEYFLSNTTDALTTFAYSAENIVWTGGRVVTTNPFASISNATVESWISFGSITSSGNSVTGTVVFNTTAATSVITATSGGTFVHNITNGTYVIAYYVWYEKTGGQQIPFNHTVNATVTTTGSTRTVTYTNTSVSYTGDYSVNSSYQEKCGDAASAVAGRQKSYDDALLVGELYKIGSAIGICTERSPSTEAFTSDADYEPVSPSQGTAVTAKFQIVRSGNTSTIPVADIVKDAKSSPPFYTATNYPHVYRLAIANFSTSRECRILSIGIRSALGIRISGLCNFRDSLTLAEIDGKACLNKQGNLLSPGDSLAVDVFNSGQMSSSEERYSFFRISYREAGTTTAYTTLSQCFGIKGITQQNIYNSIQLVMPSQKRWEFQFEPLSGWEIRSGTASGDLELIDSGLTTIRSFTSGAIGVAFRGAVNGSGPFMSAGNRATAGPDVFMLTSAQRGAAAEIGIGYSDGTSYADAWGKLAEAFVYEEIRSSAENGPEHEIVAVNEIVPNLNAPQYDNLAILGLNMRAGVEWQQFGQLSTYVLAGLRNTHLFPEILQDLFTNPRYGRGDMLTTQQIDVDSFTAASNWCADRKLFFDGAVTGKINLRQWAADVAAAHLLLFGEAGGKFWLRPAWPGTVGAPSPIAFKGIFSAGNIVAGSFSLEFFEPEDRRSIQVSVRYREERLATNLDNPGLFPVEREILVRESAPNGADSDPIESIDFSDYVTSRNHAIDAAKFVIRMRRIPDHAVKFTTTHEGVVAALEPGDYIRVVMDITHYEELRNGAVLADGKLVSSQPLSDGSYSVLAWDGSSSIPPAPSTLTVSNDGQSATPTGIIWTLINAATQTRSYQIERITPVEDGGFSIEAIHMPTNSSDIPLLAVGFDQASNWVISE